jgi:hypothetical protein
VFALIQASSTNYQRVVDESFRLLGEFIRNDSMIAAEAIFATILTFHVLVGAAELVSGKDCRLTSGPFWIRILFTALLVASFESIFVEFGRTIVRGCMTGLGDTLRDMWENWYNACLENDQWSTVSDKITGFMSLLNFIASWLVEMMTSTIGLGIATILGICLMLYMFVQGFIATGSAVVILALGPIALPFAAHENTQDIAIGYAKTFLIYVVLYMPMLLFAFQIAMTILLQVNLVTTAATAWGVGGMTEKIVCTITAPFAAAGFIWAVPNVIKGAIK